MFDIGWLELIIIGIVALIVVGPKDLPGMFRTVGRFMGKARGMAREFQRSMEEAADEAGINEAAKSLKSVSDPLAQARQSAQAYTKKVLDDREEAAEAETKINAPADAPVPPKPAGTPASTTPSEPAEAETTAQVAEKTPETAAAKAPEKAPEKAAE